MKGEPKKKKGVPAAASKQGGKRKRGDDDEDVVIIPPAGKPPGKIKLLSDKAKTHSAAPTTKAMQEQMKMDEKITGYFKLPVGRPPKDKKATSPKPIQAKKVAPSTIPVGSSASKADAKKRGKRSSYKNWEGGDNKLAMEAAISAALAGEDPTVAAQAIIPGIIISRGTLDRNVKAARERLKTMEKDGSTLAVSLAPFDRKSPPEEHGKRQWGKQSLTTHKFRETLQQIIIARDNLNNGASRKEVIAMICDFTGAVSKKAANHLDYLIANKFLTKLKKGGRVVSAQATTTNRTAITTEKLLRNHNTFLMALNDVRALNGNSDDFKKMEDFFVLNLDESNFMASEGVIRVIGNIKKKKQEKNTSDSRDSVTCVRIGSAGGTEGPRVYLGSGQKLQYKSLKDFRKNHKSPPGSHIKMTPSAYMTDQAWREIVHDMCKGIRAMPKIEDHKDWWCLLSLDGFGSHLDASALEIFAEYKILVIKEEGDSSQVCQAYDQLVARQDKRVVRDILDGFRYGRHGPVGQYELILIINTSLNKVDPMKWRTSHIRVNACPSQLIPFDQWVKKHAEQVSAADRFFASRSSLFDAMPAVWKHMTVEERHQFASLMKGFEAEAAKDPKLGVWRIGNVRRVMELGFVNYEDLPKLRASYLTSKEDPSVFVDPTPPTEEDIKKKRHSHQLTLDCDFTGFAFFPSDMMKEYMEDKEDHPLPEKRDRNIAAKIFRHMSNFVAMKHGWHTGGVLVPSSHLQVEVSREQIDLLNPTPRDVQMAAIIDQCSGKKATKVIAKRRIEFIEGNVNSYARILNGPTQLERIKTFNDLAASIATLQKEKDEIERKAKESKKLKAAEKAQNKLEKELKAKKDYEEFGPGCKDDVEKGIDHVLSLNNVRRKLILKIHFGYAGGISSKPLKETEKLLREYMGANGNVDSNDTGEAHVNNESEIVAQIETDVANVPSPTTDGEVAGV